MAILVIMMLPIRRTQAWEYYHVQLAMHTPANTSKKCSVIRVHILDSKNSLHSGDKYQIADNMYAVIGIIECAIGSEWHARPSIGPFPHSILWCGQFLIFSGWPLGGYVCFWHDGHNLMCLTSLPACKSRKLIELCPIPFQREKHIHILFSFVSLHHYTSHERRSQE